MSNLGSAEEYARNKQYEYKANSSLVLASNSRLLRDSNEPSGEAESLRGKIDPKRIGDRAYIGRPHELRNKNKKKKKDCFEDVNDDRIKGKRRRIVKEESGLTLNEDGGVYQPRMKETRAAYEAMLSVIQQQLGGQPLSVVSGAADEILGSCKKRA